MEMQKHQEWMNILYSAENLLSSHYKISNRFDSVSFIYFDCEVLRWFYAPIEWNLLYWNHLNNIIVNV